MGIFRDREYHITDCESEQTSQPFVKKMRDGNVFRIDRIHLAYYKTLTGQLRSQRRVELKFCLRDDEEIPGTETIEQWEMIVFPMYNVKGNEIVHGSVVSHLDSAVNGNLVLEDAKVIDCSSNHCLPDYEEVQDPVVEYFKAYVECLLENL